MNSLLAPPHTLHTHLPPPLPPRRTVESNPLFLTSVNEYAAFTNSAPSTHCSRSSAAARSFPRLLRFGVPLGGWGRRLISLALLLPSSTVERTCLHDNSLPTANFLFLPSSRESPIYLHIYDACNLNQAALWALAVNSVSAQSAAQTAQWASGSGPLGPAARGRGGCSLGGLGLPGPLVSQSKTHWARLAATKSIPAGGKTRRKSAACTCR